MRSLPSELQLIILSHLSPVDVYHLAQTCRDLYQLIEGSSDAWRACLRQKCRVEGHIWASFEDLASAVAYKGACTGPLRFRSLCSSIAAQDVPFEVVKTTYLPPISIGNEGSAPGVDVQPREAGQEAVGTFDDGGSDELATSTRPRRVSCAHLLTGGRYLLTLEEGSLLLWDLGSSVRTAEPTVILKEQLGFMRVGTEPAIVAVEVVNISTVRMVLCEAGKIQYVNKEAETPYHVEVLELRFGPKLPPTAHRLGSIKFADPVVLEHDHPEWNEPSPRPCVALADGRVAIFVGELTLVWDFSDNWYSSWWTANESEGEEPQSIFLCKDYVFHVNYTGVHAVPIADLTTHTISEETIRMAYHTNVPWNQHFLHQEQLQSKEDTQVMFPSSVTDGAPFIYEIANCTSSDFLRCEHDFYRYRLRLPHQVGYDSGSGGALTLHHIFHYPSTGLSDPVFRLLLGDDMSGIIWTGYLLDDPGLCISFHPATPLDATCPWTEVKIHELLTAPDTTLGGVRSCSFCPVSGKLVVLWERDLDESGETFLAIYDLLPAITELQSERAS